MRRAAKVDGNHSEIVAEFRRLGASVQSLAAVGKGVPDLLVGYQARNILVEVKMPKGKLTPDQQAWFSAWLGGRPLVVSSAQQVRAILEGASFFQKT